VSAAWASQFVGSCRLLRLLHLSRAGPCPWGFRESIDEFVGGVVRDNGGDDDPCAAAQEGEVVSKGMGKGGRDERGREGGRNGGRRGEEGERTWG
jgi:hypothetical protein